MKIKCKTGLLKFITNEKIKLRYNYKTKYKKFKWWKLIDALEQFLNAALKRFSISIDSLRTSEKEKRRGEYKSTPCSF